MPGPFGHGSEVFHAVSDAIGLHAHETPSLVITSRKTFDEAIHVKPFVAPATGRYHVFGIEFFFVPEFDGVAALNPANEDERAALIKAAETGGIMAVSLMMTAQVKVTAAF